MNVSPAIIGGSPCEFSRNWPSWWRSSWGSRGAAPLTTGGTTCGSAWVRPLHLCAARRCCCAPWRREAALPFLARRLHRCARIADHLHVERIDVYAVDDNPPFIQRGASGSMQREREQTQP